MNNIEFDRYSIERTMRTYSNDLLSAFDAPGSASADDSVKRNAIARAQSMLADIDYLNKIAADIRTQVGQCQTRLPG